MSAIRSFTITSGQIEELWGMKIPVDLRVQGAEKLTRQNQERIKAYAVFKEADLNFCAKLHEFDALVGPENLQEQRNKFLTEVYSSVQKDVDSQRTRAQQKRFVIEDEIKKAFQIRMAALAELNTLGAQSDIVVSLI